MHIIMFAYNVNPYSEFHQFHSFIITGNRCASINAATMALIDAGIPMKDFVCACSASYIEDTPLLGKADYFCIKAVFVFFCFLFIES